MTLEIKTNNKPRELLTWFDLSEKEREEFDWIKNPEEGGEEFFRYKGNVYCLQDFMRFRGDGIPKEFDDWEGYKGDSYFSGIVIKPAGRDWENGVIVGTYFS